MNPLSAVQWPAVALAVVASWLVESSDESRRGWGFWVCCNPDATAARLALRCVEPVPPHPGVRLECPPELTGSQ